MDSKPRFVHSTIFALVPFSTCLDIAPLFPLSRSEEAQTLTSWNPCPQRPLKRGMGSVTVTRGELHVWQPLGGGQVRLHLGIRGPSPPGPLCRHGVPGILSLGLTSFMGLVLALCPFHLKPESLRHLSHSCGAGHHGASVAVALVKGVGGQWSVSLGHSTPKARKPRPRVGEPATLGSASGSEDTILVPRTY